MSERIVPFERSNWKAVAFLIINKMLSGDNRVFLRRQLMSAENLDLAVSFTAVLGHKEYPINPEQTLQKTIQKMRDEGYIEFLDRGEYKLTKKGYTQMLAIHQAYPEAIARIKHNYQDELSKLDQ